MKIDLSRLVTESRNPASAEIDTLSTIEMLQVINEEDQKVALAVKAVLPQIAKTVDAITAAFANGGRLVYMGAGTSGRLGILDASECPPTYGTHPDMVIGLIAGGHQAILKAVENAEDDAQMGQDDLKALHLTKHDVVVGIAASGRTPYVLGGLEYAKSIGATTASIACNPECAMAKAADIAILPIVGAEVVTGSSRMKAGTAQKLVLNMLTTGAMIRSGKVFGNLMVDVEATNAKLIQRQTNIVVEATGASKEEAKRALNACDQHCKTAILMILADLDAEQAKLRLAAHNGFIRAALNNN
ncbi:N-acetylmuramic acid 6-phosphate etherase [Vibrio parahaemolyticus]|uniref:N-acetylmuramic acid 6-phosphate etherase n=1 Tax=Vibrio parahaemolyticus TaxID=670 RepID=UPI000D72CAEE|nr:N-acetylmuramic acid 6-phosphate etherase [Vibrio parahaemolyticus]MCR9645843.1 N-acetylmuramic acid 6-phosphate etherase [Vibrio parahaemolyticus]MCR9797662.1 N-acetylmuramic acid 6-phosphate etherase [Vibrio parahaemolyticus]MDF4281378.1 N-acetylmuramic acid 6-phosphate etherase [Vibrio parahaemolyticus]MDF4312268.1 N-acetylmuramic acid 6-phosphate etherase [Vibrio parahaemolyticus]MDF4963104.1 N-acetylmuramic acid 6-phosphate etherase [Vibrio parahaemolyticus]